MIVEQGMALAGPPARIFASRFGHTWQRPDTDRVRFRKVVRPSLARPAPGAWVPERFVIVEQGTALAGLHTVYRPGFFGSRFGHTWQRPDADRVRFRKVVRPNSARPAPRARVPRSFEARRPSPGMIRPPVQDFSLAISTWVNGVTFWPVNRSILRMSRIDLAPLPRVSESRAEKSWPVDRMKPSQGRTPLNDHETRRKILDSS